MWSRRAFLRAGGAIGASALAVRTNGLNEVAAASAAVADRSPEEMAAHESYLREIPAPVTLHRTPINPNKGKKFPPPPGVPQAFKRYLDFSNPAPVYHPGLPEKNKE